VSQQHHRDARFGLFDCIPEEQGIVVHRTREGDDQVEGRIREALEGLGQRGHPGQARGPAEIEAAVLIDDLFGDPAVLLHDPGLVGGADQHDMLYLHRHQFVKQLEP